MSGTNGTLTTQELDALSPYNYVPTAGVALTFIVLFSISTALHLGQALWFRIWWLLPTAVLAGIGEIIGWAGRYWSSQNVVNNTAFLMQISTTIIAPTPLLAANFIIFGRLVGILGTQYSRLTPKWYSIIFLTCDIIALVVQAIGGGTASSADTESGQKLGSNIMLAGIVFQMVALVVFSALLTEYFIRFMRNWPLRSSITSAHSSSSTLVRRRPWNQRQKFAVFGLALSSLVLFIRGVYRTIELADGWNGRIISTQVYFNVLDGMMIIIAIYTLNFFHPGVLLASKDAIVDDEDKY